MAKPQTRPRPGDGQQPPREDGGPHGAELLALCPPPASPPQALSVNELQQITDDISRLTIVHEIVLNSDFKLQVSHFSPKSLESRVKETLHKAFWDSLEEQLSASPPDYTGAAAGDKRPALIPVEQLEGTVEFLERKGDHCFFGQALLSLLLLRHRQLRSQIEEALDMELIRQEAEHEALDIHGLTMFVLGTMARLRTPVRDEEVQGLQALTDPAQLLTDIFRVLGLMKIDMLNFTAQSIRTQLQDHTIQYEQKLFQELLDSLDRTREWLCKAAAEVSASSSQAPPHPAVSGSPAVPSPGAISSSTAVPSLMSVLNQGHMNLLCWEPGQKEYPETLFMDQARLQGVQAQVNQLTVIAAVLLVTSSMCGSTLFGSPGYEAALEDISDQVLQEVSRTLARLGYPAFTTDKCTSLKGQIKSIADRGNAVQHVTGLKDLISLKSFSPVPQRLPSLDAGTQHKAKTREQWIHSFLSLFISPDGQNSQKDFPKGLDPIQEELLEVGRRFGSVIHHNRQVFGPYYSGILKKLLLPNAEPDSDAGMDSF